VSTSQQLRQHRCVVQEPAERATAPGFERYRRAEQALWRYYSVQPSERFVELDSPWARLRVLEVGSGEPVLFVHGTGGTGPDWAPLVGERPGFENDNQEDAWRQAATR
jgi:hypothetical protein